MMNNPDLLPMLEAVLFAVGEPIEISRLAHALKIDIVTLLDEHQLQFIPLLDVYFHPPCDFRR